MISLIFRLLQVIIESIQEVDQEIIGIVLLIALELNRT